MNNIYKEAIAFFLKEGKKIEGVSDLIIRGSSIDTKSCLLNWSDIDVSIVTKKINIEIYDQVRSLYTKMKENFSFKISITLISESDFHGYRHHHGIKPMYYNLMLQNSFSLQEKLLPVNQNNINELKYDCFYNIVYLMHSLRIEDMQRSSDLTALQKFCCQLLKSSNHLMRGAIFIKTGVIQEKINTKLFKTNFSNIDSDFLQKFRSFKKNWPRILKNYNELMHIREYVLPIISDIYDEMVDCFGKTNYKIIVLSNTEDSARSKNIEDDERSVLNI